MAYNGSHGAAAGLPSPEPQQYAPYRPPTTQPQSQQQQQQQHQFQSHPGAGVYGSQPFQMPQQPLYAPPQQADALAPAMTGMRVDDMVPSPLRLGRKPVAGPGMAHASPPATHAHQYPQSQPSPYSQPVYALPPTPAPSPYVSGAGTQQQLLQQPYAAYQPPYGHGAGFPTPPAPHQWQASHPQIGTPGQPTSPVVYEMDAHPLIASPPNASVVPAAEPFPASQTFIAELPGSEPPPGYGTNQSAPEPKASPPTPADSKPSTTASVEGSQDPEPVSLSAADTDTDAEPAAAHCPGDESGSPDQVQAPAPAPPPPAAADSEGLILVEKPPPPDHEGLIPLLVNVGPRTDTHPSGGSLPASTQTQPGAGAGMYPGIAGPQQPSPYQNAQHVDCDAASDRRDATGCGLYSSSATFGDVPCGAVLLPIAHHARD
ncbi:hypothetical protein C8A05DRAFT_34154 [Staphylotrichum tortipilum]|uniref:Uncharacterized protein n=1 Tax=Staphylotrichum tortipilum TaxID=2831512 RepID=A0AAN6MLN8_9PEZI|nr:hypothetical protein C8A05DRAFT_34154 [Staphylotrichum longicolle]